MIGLIACRWRSGFDHPFFVILSAAKNMVLHLHDEV